MHQKLSPKPKREIPFKAEGITSSTVRFATTKDIEQMIAGSRRHRIVAREVLVMMSMSDVHSKM